MSAMPADPSSYRDTLPDEEIPLLLPNPNSAYLERDWPLFFNRVVMTCSGMMERRLLTPAIGIWLLDSTVLMAFTLNMETAKQFALSDEPAQELLCSVQTRSLFGNEDPEQRRRFRFSFYRNNRSTVIVLPDEKRTQVSLAEDTWQNGMNFLLYEIKNILDDLNEKRGDIREKVDACIRALQPAPL
jgi:hypothetical protein